MKQRYTVAPSLRGWDVYRVAYRADGQRLRFKPTSYWIKEADAKAEAARANAILAKQNHLFEGIHQ
jgi:hypothetical protein